MKNLTTILALTFSLFFVFSCSNDDDTKKNTTTPGLTNEKKLEILTSYNWVVDDTSTATASKISTKVEEFVNVCSSKDYITFYENASGIITDYYYSGSNINDCIVRTTSRNYDYDAATNKITLVINSVEDVSISGSKSISTKHIEKPGVYDLIVSEESILFNGDKYKKGDKKIEK